MSTETTKTTASGGIGFGGLLTVLFVGLKLTGYIAWSWWWVLSPLWIPLAIVAVVLIIMLIILGITTLATSKR
jgi:membrane protein YdbS with pleckstrin-like domain